MDDTQNVVRVRIERVNIPIGDLAVFWFKLVVAAIPTALLVALVYAVLRSFSH